MVATARYAPLSPRDCEDGLWFFQMSHFDDFYGSDNYSGYHNQITVDHSKEIVCHSQSVEIVQQQLAVLREYVKKYVTSRNRPLNSILILLSYSGSSPRYLDISA